MDVFRSLLEDHFIAHQLEDIEASSHSQMIGPQAQTSFNLNRLHLPQMGTSMLRKVTHRGSIALEWWQQTAR